MTFATQQIRLSTLDLFLTPYDQMALLSLWVRDGPFGEDCICFYGAVVSVVL
jgi:hypothetical protein